MGMCVWGTGLGNFCVQLCVSELNCEEIVVYIEVFLRYRVREMLCGDVCLWYRVMELLCTVMCV